MCLGPTGSGLPGHAKTIRRHDVPAPTFRAPRATASDDAAIEHGRPMGNPYANRGPIAPIPKSDESRMFGDNAAPTPDDPSGRPTCIPEGKLERWCGGTGVSGRTRASTPEVAGRTRGGG